MYGSDSCGSVDQLMIPPPVRSIGQSVTQEENERDRKWDSVREEKKVGVCLWWTKMEENLEQKEDGVGLLVWPLTFQLNVSMGNTWSESRERGRMKLPIHLDGCSQVASSARQLIRLCLCSLPERGRTSPLQYHGGASTRWARLDSSDMWLSFFIFPPLFHF